MSSDVAQVGDTLSTLSLSIISNELHLDIVSRNWSEVRQLMVEKPYLVNELDEDGMTPLHTAMNYDRLRPRPPTPENICMLLIEGATQATLDMWYWAHGWTRTSLLHAFSNSGYAACVTRVLQKSSLRINTQNLRLQETPLHCCADAHDLTFEQHLNIVSVLLSNRADVTIKDQFGGTAAELYDMCKTYDKNKKEEEKHIIGCLLRGEVPYQIVLKGCAAILIYVKAFDKGSEQYKKCNLVVVGQARAGKTSLIKRMTEQRFKANEEETDGIVTTVTCEIDEHDEEWNVKPTKSIGQRETSNGLSLKIYDFAGQEIYYTTHQVFLMSRAVFMLLFDLTLDLNAKAVIKIGRGHRLKDLPRWMVKVATFLGWNGNVKVYELDMTNLDFITYWLCSIYAHTEENKQKEGTQAKQLSPPIFIVGTHKNSLPGNESRRNAKVEAIFDMVRRSLKEKPFLQHVVTKYYAVDSSSSKKDREIKELQHHILDVVKGEPYMNERISAAWLRLELTLEELSNDMNLMEMTKVRDIAADCGVEDGYELTTFLQFQHDTGNCVYFENKANLNDPLNLYIILNQMWLNGMFKCVITIKPGEFAQFSESWDRLESQGLLDEKLARHVWRKYKTDPNLLFNLMSRFDLLCEMQFSIADSARRLAEGTRVFCLPCCLSETIEAPTVVDDDNCTVHVFVDFAGFLPRGLFFRLMVRTIRFSQERGGRDQRLSRYSAEFYVDQDHHLVLRIFSKDRSFMEVIVVRVAGGGVHPSPAVCQMVYEFLMAALKDICNIWSKGVKFTFGIPCDQCQDETDRLHLHNFDECTQALRVPCKGRRMDTARFQRLFVKGLDHVYVQETKNFQAIQSLVTDLGTGQMRKFFLSQTKVDKADVGQFLIQEEHNGIFKGVRLFGEQKLKMFRKDADINKFDITLMMILIRHCCGVSCPANFWTNPDEQDHSELANLARIREYRNMKLAHNHNNRIPANEFKDEWKKLTAIFQGTGVAVDDIDKYHQIAL